PADGADVHGLPADRRGRPRRLAVGPLLRRRLAEVEPACGRGDGAPARGAKPVWMRDAARDASARLVLPGAAADAALPVAEAAQPPSRRRLQVRGPADEGVVADGRRPRPRARRSPEADRPDGGAARPRDL